MKEFKLKAYAKVNLSIDVIGKRDDGYHEVRMVMHQIDLWDLVSVNIEENAGCGKIFITSNRFELPCDRTNLAYRAIELIKNRFPDKKSCCVRIHLEKRIPLAAGLAGGSADGAAVLHAMNKLWRLDLSLDELMELGVKLGADVPFCIMGQAAADPDLGFPYSQVSTCSLATGIGEILTPLPSLNAWLVLSKPHVPVSTAEVYSKLDLGKIEQRPDTETLISGLKGGNFNKITSSMYNVLQPVSQSQYPQITQTIMQMQSIPGDHKVMMSGSGPTVFAVGQNQEIMKKIYDKMKNINEETFLIKI